ncbi:hypothetical protein HDU97_004565 [Phlyctochytrium planicorne]|nr:hypothetical protein HDU97_004565 [Phlyctochytrium planicorne]
MEAPTQPKLAPFNNMAKLSLTLILNIIFFSAMANAAAVERRDAGTQLMYKLCHQGLFRQEWEDANTAGIIIDKELTRKGFAGGEARNLFNECYECNVDEGDKTFGWKWNADGSGNFWVSKNSKVYNSFRNGRLCVERWVGCPWGNTHQSPNC